MESIHDMQLWVFFIFPKQKIFAQRCGRGRIKLERMAIVEFILLIKLIKQGFCHTFPVIPKAQITENVWRQKSNI